MKETHKLKFGHIVKTLAEFSTNGRLKVGALILKNGRVISTGYNGTIPGESDNKIMQDGHDISTIHAEQNAIYSCAMNGISTKDCILVTSHFPCQICTKAAIMSGIKKIYYVDDYRNDDNVFKDLIEIEKI